MVLMPMWMLSGAVFPIQGSGVFAMISKANPLTYGVANLRELMWRPGEVETPHLLMTLGILSAVTAVFFVVSNKLLVGPVGSATENV